MTIEGQRQKFKCLIFGFWISLVIFNLNFDINGFPSSSLTKCQPACSPAPLIEPVNAAASSNFHAVSPVYKKTAYSALSGTGIAKIFLDV